MKVVCASLAVLGALYAPAFAQQKSSPPNYVALALADGPSAGAAVAVQMRGTSVDDVVGRAYTACRAQAAIGFAHTCQVWYGDAWLVGTVCANGSGLSRLAIGDDATSPEAAREKALRLIGNAGKADNSDCRVVAQVNANGMRTGLSAAQDSE